MDLKKAYQILNLQQGAPEAEVRRRFRELSKLYHPDVSKDPDAEAKFKEANQAFQRIINPSPKESNEIFTNVSGFRNPMADFFRHNIRMADNINIKIQLSFAESILGINKELKFKRQLKCQQCNGEGYTPINNGCTKCNGMGTTTIRKGNAIFTSTCPQCHGRTNHNPCQVCSSTGSVEGETVINVSVPPGVQDKNILRLGGIGNFSGTFGPMDNYTDVLLEVSVTPDPNLSLNNDTVNYTLSISLLEALQGCIKEVPTVIGNKQVIVNPQSRHKEEISIPNAGIGGVKPQKVILDVLYPENIEPLISSLTKEN